LSHDQRAASRNIGSYSRLTRRRHLALRTSNFRCYTGASATRRAAARAALASVGLAGWEHHTPAELSGGQQQRVAIARAMVTRPAVLLADEPTGNLDTQRGLEIMELIWRLNVDHGITVLMVTHEPDMAAYARRIVRFVDGQVESDRPNPRPAGLHLAAAAKGIR
jgi:putative ABC transport system ATP-binding protein